MPQQDLTTTATALASTADDTTYTLQNQSVDVMYVEVTTSAPANSNAAFEVRGGDRAYASHGSGDSIFVWSNSNGSVVYDESA